MDLDSKHITTCIKLAEKAYKKGDMPFGCVITYNNKVIAKAYNRAHSSGKIFDHAEVLAIKKALKVLKSKKLDNCTLYSSFEPCPMCSFLIRELHIKKVVFSLPSPDMGGYSKWQILQNNDLHKKFINHFIKPPVIVKNLLANKAQQVWDQRAKDKKNNS